jgi:DNA-binding IclR family transcriptional regulator
MVREASLDAYKNGKFGGTHNVCEQKILNCLKKKPWICRHEIVELTGLTLTTVSGRCSDMKKKEWIVESDRQLTKYSKVKIGLLALASEEI